MLMSVNKKKIYLVLGYILALSGILFRIIAIIPSVTNYPFPIGWSEGEGYSPPTKFMLQ